MKNWCYDIIDMEKIEILLISPYDIFPSLKNHRLTKSKIVTLANKVATALKKERVNLVKEQQENNTSSRFFQGPQ